MRSSVEAPAGSLPVLVAGGGIGGLAAGLALRRAGLGVRVLEQAPELAVVGAGLSLQANALLALDVLGLAGTVTARGARLDAIRFLRRDGTVLSDLALAPVSERLGAPFVGIHRADLQAILVEAFGSDDLLLGACVSGFETSPEGVTAVLVDGRRVPGRALVVADGTSSALRKALLGTAEPRSVGFVAWRGVARVPPGRAAPRLEEALGPGLRFGRLPLDEERLYWYAVTPASEPSDGSAAEVKARLVELFTGWAAPVVPLLEATPAQEILRTDILYLPTPKPWTRGRVTLLGDAAHPTTPDLGQGACQALEDAVVLGESLARAGDVERGFRAYEETRRRRARWFARQSRLLGRVLNARTPAGAFLRDLAVRATPSRLAGRRLASMLRPPFEATGASG